LEGLGKQHSLNAIKIFATDIDEHALAFARKGVFQADELKGLSPELRKKYFIAAGDSFRISSEVKRLLIFSRHDITHDPPFLNIDLISCRNLLIYFDRELQEQTLHVFHYSLSPGGIMVLGKSEGVGQRNNLFEEVHPKTKIFQRNDAVSFPSLSHLKYRDLSSVDTRKDEQVAGAGEASFLDLAYQTIAKTYEHPFAVIDEHMHVVETQGGLRLYLDPKPEGGSQHILKMANRELHHALHNLIVKVRETKVAARSQLLPFDLFDQHHAVRLEVKPLLTGQRENAYYLVVFERQPAKTASSTPGTPEQEDLRVAGLEQDLATALEQLDTYRQELDVINAEAQSLTEELQSANEELKSANEELETSNEELRSVNEELFTSNRDLRNANDALLRKEQALLLSQETVARNEERFRLVAQTTHDALYDWDRVGDTFWCNEGYQRLIGHPPEAAEWWAHQVHPADQERVTASLQEALENRHTTWISEYRVASRNGRSAHLTNKAFILRNERNEAVRMIGAISDITVRKQAEMALTESENRYRALDDATMEGIAIVVNNRILEANQALVKMFGYTLRQTLGKEPAGLIPALADDAQWEARVAETIPTALQGNRKNGQAFPIEVTVRTTVYKGMEAHIVSIRDVSAMQAAQQELQRFREVIDQAGEAILLISCDNGQLIDGNRTAATMLGMDLEALSKSTLRQIMPSRQLQQAAAWRAFV
ncbi:MAG: CheR family methyltransferase, partial [Bacteroidota bacterium]